MTPLPLSSTRVTVPEHVITRAVGDSTVLLDIVTGQSFTLDVVGSRVWALLASLGSTEAAFNQLLNEFDADPRQLQEDLDALVAQLVAGGLLIVDAPSR